MKRIFITIDHQDFAIEYKFEGHWINGDCYPVDRFDDDFTYVKQVDGSGTKTKSEARCYYGFLFCWRGVWEGRIYFKDEEYWSEELKEISTLWEALEPMLKSAIKEKFPGSHYDD